MERSLAIRLAGRDVSLADKSHAQPKVRPIQVCIQPQRLPIFFHRLFLVVALNQQVAEIAVKDGGSGIYAGRFTQSGPQPQHAG